jgi:hypothetical protein
LVSVKGSSGAIGPPEELLVVPDAPEELLELAPPEELELEPPPPELELELPPPELLAAPLEIDGSGVDVGVPLLQATKEHATKPTSPRSEERIMMKAYRKQVLPTMPLHGGCS